MWSGDRVQLAIDFAARVHDGQTVPGRGFAYIVHPLSVCAEVMRSLAREGSDRPDLAVLCAILHDTLEDTAATYQDIVGSFGRNIADGVRALSKDPALPKEARMADSLRRIREQPREVGMVKLADRIVNLQEPPEEWDRPKRAAYRDEAIVIRETLGNCSAHLTARLDEKIRAYEAFLR
ncbi:MAG TPA: HD domain-containing protein [Spirochaetota bacterium]|nr:HD domain-containing protein [Spirochaetota bacterium]HNT12779.1 HD domain-containing protein [Spirochaetota bacterium]